MEDSLYFSLYADGKFIKDCETTEEIRQLISENKDAKSFEITTTHLPNCYGKEND